MSINTVPNKAERNKPVKLGEPSTGIYLYSSNSFSKFLNGSPCIISPGPLLKTFSGSIGC